MYKTSNDVKRRVDVTEHAIRFKCMFAKAKKISSRLIQRSAVSLLSALLSYNKVGSRCR